MFRVIAASAFAAALLAGGAAAQQSPAESLAPPDRGFFDAAALSGWGEVRLGRLALIRSEHEGVRAFAQRMIDEHDQANARLATLAQARGVALPTTPPPEQLAIENRLANAGADFNYLYMSYMVEDHNRAIGLFQDYAQTGKDAELRRFAAETLPMLQDHLERATVAVAPAQATLPPR